jgi:hypothetical protein
MTPEEDIGAWCSRYKHAKAMDAYIIMVEKKEPRSQEWFVAHWQTRQLS